VSNVSQPVPESIPQSESGPSGSPPSPEPPPVQELDVLNDDVMIEVAPNRPCGSIRVKLVYDGRSLPIPADDPWAE
jgi:hypothetical protein